MAEQAAPGHTTGAQVSQPRSDACQALLSSSIFVLYADGAWMLTVLAHDHASAYTATTSEAPVCSNSSGALAPVGLEVQRVCAQADDPLLLRMLRGEKVDRPPVWMMRQAGRYMKVYQDLCKKHKTFRERSENVDLAVQTRL